jgi:mRNA interferase ChpB
MAYIPDQGDIVHLEFDPSAGQEMKGPHFGLVVSSKLFNKIGLAMICPISQGNAEIARNMGTIVTLMGTGTDTQGSIYCHQLKSMDWRIRQARLKEKVPSYVVDEALARINAIFE